MIPTRIWYEFLRRSTTTALFLLALTTMDDERNFAVTTRCSHVGDDDPPADCWRVYLNRRRPRKQEAERQFNYATWSLSQKGGEICIICLLLKFMRSYRMQVPLYTRRSSLQLRLVGCKSPRTHLGGILTPPHCGGISVVRPHPAVLSSR